MLAKKEILGMRSIGYWSAFGGVEVKEIKDDICYCVSNAWYGSKKARRLKIRYNTDGAAYIVLDNSRLKFDDCLRINL